MIVGNNVQLKVVERFLVKKRVSLFMKQGLK
jgi:hypothetical protein